MGSYFSTARSNTSDRTLDDLYDDNEHHHDGPMVFEEGEFVEVQWKGGMNWYNAVIIKRRMDGTYDIRYNDGSQEVYLDPEFIRRKHCVLSPDEGPMTLEEGDLVEARWKGGNRWYNAVVVRTHTDGTYDIQYNDGDQDLSVGTEFIRQRRHSYQN